MTPLLWPYPPIWARCLMALVVCAVVALGMCAALAVVERLGWRGWGGRG